LQSERGQALVEFALVANIFLLLLLVTFQGGVAFFNKLALEQATREAARKVIVLSGSETPAQLKADAAATVLSRASNLDPAKLSPRITVDCQRPPSTASTLCVPGDNVIVSVSGYPWSLGFGPARVSGGISVSTQMRIEG
jgi:Flp pilus assembly protein TadG